MKKVYTERGRKIALALRGRKKPRSVVKQMLKSRKENGIFAEAMKERSNNKVWLRHLSESHMGHKQSQKTKDKRAESCRQFYVDNPEAREKIGEKSSQAWEDMSDSRRAKRCRRIGKSNSIAKLGFVPTESHKKAISRANKLAYKEGRRVPVLNPWKMVEYDGQNYRSSWEAALATWLDKYGIKFKYEPRTFDLGDTTWRPDFYIPRSKIWIEVKGYVTDDFWKKVIKFHKLYPNKRLLIMTWTHLTRYGII